MSGKRLILLPEAMLPGLLGSWYLLPGPTGMGKMLEWIGMVTLWHPGEQQFGSIGVYLQLDCTLALQSMCLLMGIVALGTAWTANCASLFHCLSAQYYLHIVCMHRDSLLHAPPIVALQLEVVGVHMLVWPECRYADEYVVGRAHSRDPWRGAPPPPPPPAARHASPRDRSPRRRDPADRYR